MDNTREATLVRIRARFQEAGCVPDLSGYTGVDTPIPFICSCGEQTSRPWKHFNANQKGLPRKVQCVTCGNRRSGTWRTEANDVLGQIRALCTKFGVTYVEGTYWKNSAPFQFICREGHLGSKKWMDVRTDHLRGHLRFHCKVCWEAKRPRAETHHWYKPERSDEERDKDRSTATPGYFPWRNRVRLQNNHTCCLTGKRGSDQAVHHLWNYADHPDLRLFDWNGVCILDKWHDKFHGEYGRSFNDLAQLQEFALKHGLLVPFLHQHDGFCFDVEGEPNLERRKDAYVSTLGKRRVLIPWQIISHSPDNVEALFQASEGVL